MEPTSPPPPDRAARTLPLLALAVGSLLVLTLGEQFLSLFGFGLRCSVPGRHSLAFGIAAVAVGSLLLWRSVVFGAGLALAVSFLAVVLHVVGVMASAFEWPAGWYGNLQVQDGAAVLLSPTEPYEVIGGPWR